MRRLYVSGQRYVEFEPTTQGADVRDPDGRLANVEINRLGLTQGSGWLEFRWPNPATKRIELKAAYVLKVDDSTVCGSGYYKGGAP